MRDRRAMMPHPQARCACRAVAMAPCGATAARRVAPAMRSYSGAMGSSRQAPGARPSSA